MSEKRQREQQQQVGLMDYSTEELIKLVELKNKKNLLLKQLEDLDAEITNLHKKKEEVELARTQSEQQSQMREMEPYMAKISSISNHLQQVCAYTKELSSKVSALEDKKEALLKNELEVDQKENRCVENQKCFNLENTDHQQQHPIWIAHTLQRRCLELEEFTNELSNLQLVLDCTNQNLSDYRSLLKVKKQLDNDNNF